MKRLCDGDVKIVRETLERIKVFVGTFFCTLPYRYIGFVRTTTATNSCYITLFQVMIYIFLNHF